MSSTSKEPELEAPTSPIFSAYIPVWKPPKIILILYLAAFLYWIHRFFFFTS